jgi:sulfur relay (sulfurtransferase) DsrC/TusE family protein
LDAASKHLTAEEVDFYVEGLEENPLEVVSYIMDYYQKFNQTDLNRFIKCKKNNRNLTHPGWYNKEIIILLL